LKRLALLRHLRRYGCVLKREGARHSLWMNPVNGAVQTVPRHTDIPDRLAERICTGLVIPPTLRARRPALVTMAANSR
jgi:mRNA interferase HicA